MEFLKILPIPLLLVITMASNLAASVTKKQFGNLGSGGRDNAYIYSLITSAVCTVLMVLFSGFRITLSWYTVGLGLLFGVCTMLTTVLLTMAMSIGPMSYSMVINTSSTVITALSGFLFWNEKLGALKIAGLVLMAGCFVFSVKKDSDKKHASLVWFLLALFSAVAGAGVGLLQKIHQSSAHSEELMGFLIIAFAFSFVTSAVPYLWHRRGSLFGAKGHSGQPGVSETEEAKAAAAETDAAVETDAAAAGDMADADAGVSQPREGGNGAADAGIAVAAPAGRRFRWGKGAQAALLVGSGVAVALNNIINLYLAGAMDSAVFFPLVNGVGLVLGIVAGLIVFREKLTLRQWIGIVCGVAATLLLCL